MPDINFVGYSEMITIVIDQHSYSEQKSKLCNTYQTFVTATHTRSIPLLLYC